MNEGTTGGRVSWDDLLHIDLEQIRAWVPHSLGRPPSVFRFLLVRNDKRKGVLRMFLAADLAVAARSSISGSTGKGQGAYSVVT